MSIHTQFLNRLRLSRANGNTGTHKAGGSAHKRSLNLAEHRPEAGPGAEDRHR